MTQRFRTIPGLFILALPFGLLGYTFIPSNLCTSTIKASKKYFSAGDPILISYSIKNISRDTVIIWDCGFWCNNKIEVTDKNNIELSRTNWGKTTLSAFSPGGGPRNKNVPVVLAPGQTDAAYEQYDLKDQFLFKVAGDYIVRYFYDDMNGNTEIKIESNTLKIHVGTR